MIAPQARDLAEQNGIDWRKIRGTGEGGQIVEADILNYLTRLMFGEEELPSTPVDLPPPDWEGDVASLSMNTQALAAAGVESDITEFIASARADAAPVPQDDIDEFELELDEEETPQAAAPVMAEPALDEPALVEENVPAAATADDDFGDLDLSAPATSAHVEPAAPASTGIAGGLLSSL
ncbi:E3 binding domain-containing protein, partial [Deinococcus pimensis]|uniref:E3 binding domain-containing protein n=1 Tax=Deinococcus pimensis TaxID=309888 RepID=UPI001FE1920F